MTCTLGCVRAPGASPALDVVGAEEDVARVAGELPHPDVPVPLTPHPTVLQLGRPALIALAKRKN